MTTLAGAAGFRRADMEETDGALGHLSSDGRTPNEVVEDYGFLLPWWWPDSGNNVETIFGGPEERLLPSVLGSALHRSHLLGQGGYAAHREIGRGTGRRLVGLPHRGAREAPTFLTGVGVRRPRPATTAWIRGRASAA